MIKGTSSVPVVDFEPVLSLSDRVNLEEQLIIPEYLPDIERVIFLDARSSVSGINYSEKEAVISGLCFLCLIYESPEGIIKKSEYTVPFSKSFSSDESLSEPLGFSRSFCFSSSFKLISKRRLDARIVLSLEGKIYNKNEAEILEKSQNPDIILKEEKVTALVPCDSINEVVSFSDEIFIPDSDIGEILCCATDFFPENCRIQNKKLTLTGNIHLKVLYSCEEGKRIKSFETDLPLKKEWDNLSLNDDFIAEHCFDVLSNSLSRTEEVSEDEGKFLLECEIGCSVYVFAPSCRCLATDGFSPSYEYKKEILKPFILKTAEHLNYSKEIESEISAPTDMREIENTFASLKNISVIDEDIKKCFFEAAFSILYKNADNRYSVFTSSIKSDIPLNDIPKESDVIPSGSVSAPFAELKNGKIRLGCCVNIDAKNLKGQKEEFISGIDIDEEKKIEKRSGYPIILYYADENDSLWDISKRYNVSPCKIKEINSLKEEIFKERTPVIIPV